MCTREDDPTQYEDDLHSEDCIERMYADAGIQHPVDAAIEAWKAANPKIRFSFIVSVDRDGIPGWGNTPEDFQKHIQSMLDNTIPHYNPKVVIEKASWQEIERLLELLLTREDD